MASKKKLLQAAAGSAGGAVLDVDEVFSTYLYDGAGNTAQTITNGIDLDGEGGLVWFKARSVGIAHGLFDSENNDFGAYLASSSTNASNTLSHVTANSDGFSLSANGYGTTNGNGVEYVSWTFRKAPKFFDVVTYTGNGVSGRSISHNLNSSVGMILFKRTDSTSNWIVWHRSGGGAYGFLDATDAFTADSGISNPTTTVFTIESTINAGWNASGGTYVAYLFAHNDGDGDFGPDGDADIIKCGSYTGNGSTDGPEINLGFEPQWIMIKESSSTGDWAILDNMRGIGSGGAGATDDNGLDANKSNAEYAAVARIDLTSTGFKVTGTSSDVNTNSETYIYMAIRRGPLAAPEDATKVFSVHTGNTDSTSTFYTSGFPVDFGWEKTRGDTFGHYSFSRLQGSGKTLRLNVTNAESAFGAGPVLDSNTQFTGTGGIGDQTSNGGHVFFVWKRAPSYFDVVCYSGSSGTQNISHNLGVQPEMIWIKNRDSSDLWVVQVTSLGARKYLNLNGTGAAVSLPTWNGKDYFANTLPTASVFTVGGGSGYDPVGSAGYNYIAYLFATVAGVSKVGSYTGNGESVVQTIDCGFTSGARFVLIKKSSSTGNWIVYDAERGISTATSDGVLLLNSTNAESAESSFFGGNAMQPDSSGFKVTTDDLNRSGNTYIFYAIA